MLESRISTQMDLVKGRDEKMVVLESVYSDWKQKQKKVTFNVSGKIFTTSKTTIEQHKDTLFNAMLESYSLNNKEEIYLDRNPVIFSILFNYIRKPTLNFKKLSKQELFDLKLEAEFFEVWDLVSAIEDKYEEVKFIGFTSSGPYIYKGVTAGTNKLEDLSSKDTSTGICANTPGSIVLELSKEVDFEEIEVAGFTGNKTVWYHANGTGAKIFTSKNGKDWENIGTLRSLTDKISTQKFNKVNTAKYIKFESNTFVGLGYLKIIELKDDE